MSETNIIDVWAEIQITEEGVGIALISERQGEGAMVEDIEHVDLSEIGEIAGEIRHANLGGDAREALVANLAPSEEEIMSKIEDLHSPTVPDPGTPMVDDSPAPWSDDARVIVSDTSMSGMSADEYVIDTNPWGDEITVADRNPEYPSDDPVVLARYVGSEKEYAFPVTRLVEPESHHFPYPQARIR